MKTMLRPIRFSAGENDAARKKWMEVVRSAQFSAATVYDSSLHTWNSPQLKEMDEWLERAADIIKLFNVFACVKCGFYQRGYKTQFTRLGIFAESNDLIYTAIYRRINYPTQQKRWRYLQLVAE